MKAILVLNEMPSACKECPLRASIDTNFCVKTLLDVTDKEYYEQKPDWCPLRPMPQKANHPDFCDAGRYDKGYNACIDEILGDKE